ncbi:aureocin A53 family class IId bacteriocin [Oceanobacillus halophilus]|uniref:Bacteriocin aureocin A53 n=1 Tax=Oceanobacillus halophilus TaxID=930130 RepID=A0A494ZVK6_9BACI|nr:aureocin A53 family class IId bacteriocin [Oceanobacillus halophilus]RKQ30243.1 bacteriocin aureocin A53 [Oceanobacillus halophilus]
MATFLRLVAQLGSKAAKWAWNNKGRVLDWIRNGMAIEWIIDKINSIIN